MHDPSRQVSARMAPEFHRTRPRRPQRDRPSRTARRQAARQPRHHPARQARHRPHHRRGAAMRGRRSDREPRVRSLVPPPAPSPCPQAKAPATPIGTGSTSQATGVSIQGCTWRRSPSSAASPKPSPHQESQRRQDPTRSPTSPQTPTRQPRHPTNAAQRISTKPATRTRRWTRQRPAVPSRTRALPPLDELSQFEQQQRYCPICNELVTMNRLPSIKTASHIIGSSGRFESPSRSLAIRSYPVAANCEDLIIISISQPKSSQRHTANSEPRRAACEARVMR